jgi:hypothetical protein
MLALVRRARGANLRDRFWVCRAFCGASLCVACGFPKYDFLPTSGAGTDSGGAGFSGSSVGMAAAGGAGAGGVGSGAGGTGTGDTGGGGEAQAGASGALAACTASAGAAGSGGAATLASHCSDGKKDGDETGLDCGGPVCTICFHAEGCQHDSDCISGDCTSATTCQPVFDLQFKTSVVSRNTDTMEFQLQLTYLDTTAIELKDITLRYYFARGDVADPVVPYATQASVNGVPLVDASSGPQVSWNIVRVLPDDTALADSYLEITSSSSKKLITGDKLELTQSIQNGTAAGRQFDQLTDYSFQNATSYAIENQAAVYRDGKRAWGVPPPYSVPEQCFYAAVNFAGDAFTSTAGLDFRAGTDPIVQFSGSTYQADATSGLTPAPDADQVPMLDSAIVLDSESATLSVPNGQYWFYPYVISGNGSNTADLLVQGVSVDTFSAETVAGAPAWARLGPYSVEVTNGKLVLASRGGVVRVAGAELYQAAQ